MYGRSHISNLPVGKLATVDSPSIHLLYYHDFYHLFKLNHINPRAALGTRLKLPTEKHPGGLPPTKICEDVPIENTCDHHILNCPSCGRCRTTVFGSWWNPECQTLQLNSSHFRDPS
ncbi:hypothetical protein BDR04DRAFT_793186 [Suillus decipiens]|nr:hypothetical protein BDR04DRAFT_793186 [Suillus decipiens]